MSFWVLLWKLVFIVTVLLFAGLSVWVTIQGAKDIKALLKRLRERHPERLSHEPVDDHSGPQPR